MLLLFGKNIRIIVYAWYLLHKKNNKIIIRFGAMTHINFFKRSSSQLAMSIKDYTYYKCSNGALHIYFQDKWPTYALRPCMVPCSVNVAYYKLRSATHWYTYLVYLAVMSPCHWLRACSHIPLFHILQCIVTLNSFELVDIKYQWYNVMNGLCDCLLQ